MRALLPALLLLAACGRPLTPNEATFLRDLQGDTLDPAQVRIHDGLAVGPPRVVPAPPRLTCQARLFPPPRGSRTRVSTGATAIFQDVFVRPDLYREDFVKGWPEVLPLADAMLLAHEAVHAWQWQNREITEYHPLKAALEHARSTDPYLFDLDTDTDFLAYGYEQQGAIMEEYVCCRTLAPEAERTGRLHAMLAEYFPLKDLDEPLTEAALLPWDGVEVEGICGP